MLEFVLPRRARRITVDGRDYVWLVGRPDGPFYFDVVVQGVSGRGCKLIVRVEGELTRQPTPDGTSLTQASQIGSSIVASGITRAWDLGWRPNEAAGKDFILYYRDGAIHGDRSRKS